MTTKINRTKLRQLIYRAVRKHTACAIMVSDVQLDQTHTYGLTQAIHDGAWNGRNGDETACSNGREYALVLDHAIRILERDKAVRVWLCSDSDLMGSASTKYDVRIDISARQVTA